jgi:hypothetical protein
MTVPLTEHKSGTCHAIIGEVHRAAVATVCGEPATIAIDGQQSSWCEQHYRLYTVDPAAPRVRSEYQGKRRQPQGSQPGCAERLRRGERTGMAACAVCSKPFEKKSYQARYCSEGCRRKINRARHLAWKKAQKAKVIASTAVPEDRTDPLRQSDSAARPSVSMAE